MTSKALSIAGALLLSVSAFAADPPSRGAPADSALKGGSDYQMLLRRATPLKRVDASACKAPAGGSCVVSVTIGEKCAIRVSPEYLHVRTKGQVTLLWKISPARWSFEEKDGIAFKGSAEPFTDGRRLAPQVWQWKDRNERPGYFAYGVNVVSDKGQKCSIDPGVFNDPTAPGP